MTSAGPLPIGLAETDLALSGLRWQLKVLRRENLSGRGIEFRRDQVQEALDRLLELRLRHMFLRDMARAWWLMPGESMPVWPARTAADRAGSDGVDR